MKNSKTSVTFTVTNVAKSGATYNASANHDPDGAVTYDDYRDAVAATDQSLSRCGSPGTVCCGCDNVSVS